MMVPLDPDAFVAVCDGLEREGLDPVALAENVSARGVAAGVVGGPCGDDGWLSGVSERSTSERVVLGICPDGPSKDEIAVKTRRGGRGPFSVAPMDVAGLSGLGSEEERSVRAGAVLAARAAGLGSSPAAAVDSLRLRLPAEKVSRRSFLSVRAAVYEPVAGIDDACLGTARCSACVGACPVDAISPDGWLPSVSREACVGCGACVAVCPVDAVRLPGVDRRRFEAELASLSSAAAGMGAGLLLYCAGSGLPGGSADPWLPVELPCLSMVTAAWLLSPLAAGVPTVGLRGCGSECSAGGGAAGDVADFVLKALVACGVADASARVRLDLGRPDDAEAWEEPVPGSMGSSAAFAGLLEPSSTVSALASLPGWTAATGRIASPGSPLGAVVVEAAGCTLCAVCADACPTGALAMESGPVSVALTFAAGACMACGNCVQVCPEKVVGVERDVVRHCRRCGNPVAPASMLDRLESLLGDSSPRLLDSIKDLCLDCRQLGRGASADS